VKKIIIQFGLLMAASVILLQLSKYTWSVQVLSSELIIIVLALIFASIGFYLSRIFVKKPKPTGIVDENKIVHLGLSSREVEVLTEMADGKSNLEIAESLYISESTVKTHVSNVLLKLDSKRRTESVRKARELSVII